MLSWEQATSRVLHLFHLDSIRHKVLAFALLATLIPSLTMAWQSYVLNKRFITGKLSGELRNATVHTVREFDLWLKERFYEMRVFSSSYEVTENVEKILGAPQASSLEPQRRLTDYLKSVRGKFLDYEELMVIAPAGQLLSTSVDRARAPSLPPDWVKQAKADAVIVGETYWDRAGNKGVMVIAVPVKATNGRFLGVMAAKLNFRTVEQILGSFPLGKTGQAYLVNRDGTLIISSGSINSWSTASTFMKTRLPVGAVQALFEQEGASLTYDNYQGKRVIGSLKRVPQLGWGAVAEIGQEEAYAQTNRIRNLTLLMVAGLLVSIGLTAYLLGLTIVRPLDRLTAGATKVASGDLEVDLPVVGHGELGYMTEVFNHMVTRLRQGRDELAAINAALQEKNRELQELSVTDGLTGLRNRKHLMETLAAEVERARRLEHPFSLMMIDIDHFKQYNDAYGHPAGDILLTRVASLFRDLIRSIDYAARYGGEEFMLVLHEVGAKDALLAAERIQRKVAAERFDGERAEITVSIGVATFPRHGDTPEAIVASADAALYQAKRRGRNLVVLATNSQDKELALDRHPIVG